MQDTQQRPQRESGAASRLKREVERARSAKPRTTFEQGMQNKSSTTTSKGGDNDKRANTSHSAITESELKRRNYQAAKVRREGRIAKRQQMDVILTNAVLSNAISDKDVGNVDLRFNAPAFDVLDTGNLFANETQSIFDSQENLFADPKLPKQLQADRNKVAFLNKASNGYQPITEKELDKYWVGKYGKVCPYQSYNTAQHMPGSLAAINQSSAKVSEHVHEEPRTVSNKPIPNEVYDRLNRKSGKKSPNRPPRSAPSLGRKQENTYIYHSNRNRGGGLVQDPTGSFKGPRDRTQVISRRQQALEEQRERQEISRKEFQEKYMSPEEEATLYIRAALIQISGDIDSEKETLNDIQNKEGAFSEKMDDGLVITQGKLDASGEGSHDKRESKADSPPEPPVHVMYIRSPTKHGNRLHSAPSVSRSLPSNQYNKLRDWNSSFSPQGVDSSQTSDTVLPNIVDEKSSDGNRHILSDFAMSSSSGHKSGSTINKKVSYETMPTNNQDRFSHFKSAASAQVGAKKIKPHSAPFARTQDRLINEGDVVSRIEKEIQWQQGKLAATEERLRRSLTTSIESIVDSSVTSNDGKNVNGIIDSTSVNSTLNKLSSVEKLHNESNEDLLSLAKKSESAVKDKFQIDSETADPMFAQTMVELRKKFEHDDIEMRRILRNRPRANHLTGRSRKYHQATLMHSKRIGMLDETEMEELKQLRRMLEAESYKVGGADLLALFDTIDEDGGGTIGLEEFSKHVRRLVPNITDKQMRLFMSILDKDKEGGIERKEFVEFIGGKAADRAKKSMIQRATNALVAEKKLQEKMAKFDPSKDNFSKHFVDFQAHSSYMETVDPTKLKHHENDKSHLYSTIKNVMPARKKIPARSHVEIRKPQTREEMLQKSKKNHSRFKKFMKPASPVVTDLDLYPDKNLTDQAIAKDWEDVARALKIKPMMTESEIVQLFHRLDVDCSGSLELDELKVALEERGMLLTDEQISSIIAIVDEDKNDKLDLEEFVQLWKIVASINHKVEKDGVRLNQVYVTKSEVLEEVVEPKVKGVAESVLAAKKLVRQGLHIRTTENQKFSHVLDLNRNEYDELEVIGENSNIDREQEMAPVELKENPLMKMFSDSRFKPGSSIEALKPSIQMTNNDKEEEVYKMGSDTNTKEEGDECSVFGVKRSECKVKETDEKEETDENGEVEAENKEEIESKNVETEEEIERKRERGANFLSQIMQAHGDLHGLSDPNKTQADQNSAPTVTNLPNVSTLVSGMSNKNISAMTQINRLGKEFLGDILQKKKMLKQSTILPRVQPKILDRHRIENWKRFKEGLEALQISPLLAKNNIHVMTENQMIEFSFMMSEGDEKVERTSAEETKEAFEEITKVSVDKLVGRGKFAAVFNGTRNKDEKVAFKVAQFVSTCPSTDLYSINGVIVPPVAVCKTFLREIRLLHELSHSDYILNMHFTCAQPFLVCLEFLEGGDLYSSLNDEIWQNETSLYTRLRIMRDVAIGLRYMHHKGFVHRDLKPHNILLTYDVSAKSRVHIGVDDTKLSDTELEKKLQRQHELQNEPMRWGAMDVVAKICDFGMTVRRHDLHERDVAIFSWLDEDPQGGGTSGYTAPEVFMDEDNFDLSMDTFSFAVCLWEATTSDRDNVLVGKEGKQAANLLMNGVRPAFTSNQPIFLRKIIQSSWATEGKNRPKMEIVVQIFNELLSSPGAFMQLYNRNFFTGPDSIKSKAVEAMSIVNHYYNIRPSSPAHVEAALKVDEDSINGVRTLPNQGPDDPKPDRKFGPYDDRFDIITKAKETIEKARVVHSPSEIIHFDDNQQYYVSEANIKSFSKNNEKDGEGLKIINPTTPSTPSFDTPSVINSPKSRKAFVRMVSTELIAATKSQHHIHEKETLIEVLDKQSLNTEHDWEIHTDHHNSINTHIGESQTMLISDEITLQKVLSALRDRVPDSLNVTSCPASSCTENKDSDDDTHSSSSSDSDGSSVRHLDLHQQHEIAVDNQSYEDKALYKYKDSHAIKEVDVKNTWKHRSDGKHVRHVRQKKKRRAIITEEKESKVPAMAGITKVFSLKHNGKTRIHVGLIYVKLYCARNLQNVDLVGTSDPFPRVTLGEHEEEGPVQENNLNPIWNMNFLMPWDGISVLKIELLDEDVFDEVSESLGYVEMSLMLLEVNKTVRIDQPLKGVGKGTIKFDVTLKVLSDDDQHHSDWLIL